MLLSVSDMGSNLGEFVAAALRADLAVEQRSGKWLADACGVPYVTLQRYLSGTREIPLGVLDRVAAHVRSGAASAVVAAAEQLRDAAS